MVIESELEQQKFYFVCHHEFQVFHFYVMCLCIDENVAKKYMYNIAIQDGSRVNMYLILCSVFGVCLSLIGIHQKYYLIHIFEFRMNTIKENSLDAREQFYLGDCQKKKF